MNDMRQMTGLGRNIEENSFAIIDQEAGQHPFSPEEWQVVRRVIHSTADFEYKSLVEFHPHAIQSGIAALKNGCSIIVDVKMIQAGLNEDRLGAYGCKISSFISDEGVIKKAKEKNSTRAIEAMKKAHELKILDGSIVPIGFVSAKESKEAILNLDSPYIVSKGRKGGSAIAVAVIHALLFLSAQN